MPAIPAFPAKLNQVWTNIIDNAIDAMDGSGTLTVRTVRADDADLVEIGDTGPGIPPDVRQRIFEPFFTTKPVGRGTGLGLDVSYRVVLMHHGDIASSPHPGDTRFQVLLPIEDPGQEDARMTVQIPLASAEAVLAEGSGRAVHLQPGAITVVADHAEAGPHPVGADDRRSRGLQRDVRPHPPGARWRPR